MTEKQIDHLAGLTSRWALLPSILSPPLPFALPACGGLLHAMLHATCYILGTCYESIVDPKEVRDTDVMGWPPGKRKSNVWNPRRSLELRPGVVVSTAPARGEIQGQKDEAANQVIRHSSDTLTMGDE
ncbi:hypothetical protein ASPFODRAFT_35915 [Aspergillus luchuensis CBS 106.47]|uniref:Uncharacterized protein n=1 Tax=Aspergillus luchuensis (strain CBS 106.47) TaxID=1137211 RepID=A0A1M3T9G2_ASPLC|nr:hypothetical protein ASPFODRAFT_35915 [Aspergillus luchuensis CBS 106.47]